MPESTPPSTAQVDRLISSIGDLQRELAATRAVVEKAASRSRSAILLSVISIALLMVSFGVVLSNRASVEASNEVRDEARRVACVRENISIVDTREAISGSIIALAPPGTSLTDEQEARIAAYAERVSELLPFRDCSPEGVAAYYENPPPDPAVDK